MKRVTTKILDTTDLATISLIVSHCAAAGLWSKQDGDCAVFEGAGYTIKLRSDRAEVWLNETAHEGLIEQVFRRIKKTLTTPESL